MNEHEPELGSSSSAVEKDQGSPPKPPQGTQESKPEVRLETWKRWARLILGSIREPRALHEIYETAGRERVSQKRVDAILSVLEEAGLVVLQQNRASLSEKQGAVAATTEMELLRKACAEKDVELSAVRSKLAGVETEVNRLKAGVQHVQCERLKPLDIEGYSGQRLFYCVSRKLTMGERAELCFVCDERAPAHGQPRTEV